MKTKLCSALPGAALSRRTPLWTLSLASILLSACAAPSHDGGFDQVAALARERVGQSPHDLRSSGAIEQARSRVAELLSQPLTPDSVVEVAWLNNPGLQASFAELGLAEADWLSAGRLRNPSFSFGRLSGVGSTEVSRLVMFDVLGLLRMPMAKAMERDRFEQVQLQAAQEAVVVATEAREAYFHAVAARELWAYRQQVKDAADAADELARRMVGAGNFSSLTQMREQVFAADAATELARARQHDVAQRERLARVLGLSSDPMRLQLPDRLPPLPAAPARQQDAEQAAMDQRLDVLMAKRATEATARALGLTQATRFVNVLGVGYQNKNVTGETRSNGYQVELELPLFDFGQARVARAQASYMQSVQRTAQVAINARSEVRESYAAYLTAFELAKHYQDEVVPLRKRISHENLLRYNGMLISVFELLADAREQIISVTGSVEALRDHWIAQTQLQSAITARSPR